MKVFLFNPENDLALANGDANFVAPASARKLAYDLRMLPAYWSDTEGRLLYEVDLKKADISGCFPWGWSRAAKASFLKAGIPDESLLSEKELSVLRDLSHRRTGIEILRSLSSCSFSSFDLPEIPQELGSIAELDDFSAKHKRFVLKTPWSSSGKGLCWSGQMNDSERYKWLDAVICKMGSAIAEPVYEKIRDFAMIFQSVPGQGIVWTGYSLFETDGRGTYQYNYLFSNRMIEEELAKFVSLSDLLLLKEKLLLVLKSVIPSFYDGYFGIDMMICSSPYSKSYLLHPCVELNLRMTMGAVARIIYDRYMVGEKALFRIIYQPKPGMLHEEFGSCPVGFNSASKDSEIILLTPVDPDTRYVALIDKKEF